MPFVRCHPHRFHHGFRHHPFMMMHHGGGCRNNNPFEQALAESFPSKKAVVHETDDAVTIRMDVPGVKAHQITIEEKDGEVELVAIRMDNGHEVISETYQDVLFVDPYKVKMEEAEARLDQGVLVVRFPKKVVATDIAIELVAMHPLPGTSTNEFRVTEDFPGVKPSQLKIKLSSNDTLIVQGERTIGDRTMMMRRMIDIPRGTDMTQAKAYLMDGVLTLVAPKTELGPTALRAIYVNEMPMVEALHIQAEDGNERGGDKKEEDEIMVDTVTEEKEWEHVDEDSKPAAKN